jgi:predicted transcriptional regulator
MTRRRRRGRGGKGGHEPRIRTRQREAEVVELHVQGFSQGEIARRVGVTQPAVSQILSRVDRRFMRENQDRLAHYKAEQSRKLDHIYQESMRAWEGSKAQRTRRRQRKTNGTGGGRPRPSPKSPSTTRTAT